jgi:hypothetical protein
MDQQASAAYIPSERPAGRIVAGVLFVGHLLNIVSGLTRGNDRAVPEKPEPRRPP